MKLNVKFRGFLQVHNLVISAVPKAYLCVYLDKY